MSDGIKAWYEERWSDEERKFREAVQLDLFPREPPPQPQNKNPQSVQIGGDHYRSMAIQPIEYIQANKLTFCEGSVVKYITRHRKKGGRQDLEKAIHCIQLEIEASYGRTT